MPRKYTLKFADGAPVDDNFLQFADELFSELGLKPEAAQVREQRLRKVRRDELYRDVCARQHSSRPATSQMMPMRRPGYMSSEGLLGLTSA